MLVREAMGYNRLGKRYVTAEEIVARKERVLNADLSNCPQKTSVAPKGKTELSNPNQSKKKIFKNMLSGVPVLLFCSALCAILASNHSKGSKISMTAILCGVSGIACSITGYVKNPYRERQRD